VLRGIDSLTRLGLSAAPLAGVSRFVPAHDAKTGAPTGVGRGITTYEIPIEGRDEWLAAAGLLA
jgi:hypothetical protein